MEVYRGGRGWWRWVGGGRGRWMWVGVAGVGGCGYGW